MAPPSKNPDISFVGWLENLATLPLQIPNQTIAVYKDNFTENFLLLRVSVRASSNVKDADIQLAFAQDTAESLRDIQGVNTNINLADVVKNPADTIEKFLKGTRKQIQDLEELKDLRAAAVMSNLTRGVAVDSEGESLAKPQNPILKAAGIRFPVLDAAGKSLFQTSVAVATSYGKPRYEDRLSAETGSRPDNLEFQSYSRLGEAVTSLTGSANAVNDRRSGRNATHSEFNRSIARELNLDLDKTLSYKSLNGTEHTGRLNAELINTRGDIAPIIGNDDTVSNIVGISRADFDALDTSTQEYLRRYVKAEAFGLKLNADPSLHLNIIDRVNSQPNVYGVELKLTGNPKTPVAVTPHPRYPKPLSSDMQKKWVAFATPGMAAGKRIDAFESLRTAYLQSDLPTAWALSADDLGLNITGTRYGGVNSKSLYLTDVTFEHEKELIATSTWFKINEQQIRRDIVKRVKANPNLSATATSIYNTEKASKLATGMALIDAENAAKLAQDSFWTDTTNKTINRLSTATRSLDLANDLFYSSTTRQLLENIRDGKVVNAAFVVTRMLNTLPVGSKLIRPTSVGAKIVDPNEYMGMLLRGMGIIGDKENPGDVIAKKLGLVFESNKKEGLGGLIGIENRVAIQHETFPAGAGRVGPLGSWKTIIFSNSDAQGFFGDNSVYALIKKIDLAGHMDPASLLEDASKLNEFFETSNRMMTAVGAGTPIIPSNPLEATIVALGFNNPANLQELTDFNTNIIGKALVQDPVTGQWSFPWLEKLFTKGKLPKNERWAFLGEVVTNGYDGIVKNKYIGVLNYYNRAANALRDFLYKSVIWGDFGANIPILGKLVINPLRKFIGKLGFSEEAGLSQVIANQPFFQRMKALSTAFSGLFENPASIPARNTIQGVLGRTAAKYSLKFAGTAGGKAAFQVLAKIFGALTGTVTGGVSYVLMAFGGTIFNSARKLLRLDFKGAGQVVVHDIKDLLILAKKVILYPVMLTCACIMIPILFVFVVILGVVSYFVRYDQPVGGGVYGAEQSAKITVTKTVSKIPSSNNLRFNVTVSRGPGLKADETVTIQTFTDKLTYTPSCTIDNGKTINYGDPAFAGTVDVTPESLAIDFQGKVLTTAEPSITRSMILSGISTADSSYTNFIEVTALDDEAKMATDSATFEVGDGGCATCPSMWPIQLPARINQGPGGSWSHQTAEAADFGPIPFGTSKDIYATHNGIVRIETTNDVCTKSKTNLGCSIRLESKDGNYSTLYGHMLALDMSLKDREVSKGTKIGEMGSTGNSDGPHLHYEFPDVNYECIPGYEMRLENVAGDQYVPVTIQRSCTLAVGNACTQIFN